MHLKKFTRNSSKMNHLIKCLLCTHLWTSGKTWSHSLHSCRPWDMWRGRKSWGSWGFRSLSPPIYMRKMHNTLQEDCFTCHMAASSLAKVWLGDFVAYQTSFFLSINYLSVSRLYAVKHKLKCQHIEVCFQLPLRYIRSYFHCCRHWTLTLHCISCYCA